MDRKEFLVCLGLFFLAVTGISGALKNISSPDFLNLKQIKPVTSGFGSSPYGGVAKSKENV